MLSTPTLSSQTQTGHYGRVREGNKLLPCKPTLSFHRPVHHRQRPDEIFREQMLTLVPPVISYEQSLTDPLKQQPVMIWSLNLH